MSKVTPLLGIPSPCSASASRHVPLLRGTLVSSADCGAKIAQVLGALVE
ncbi:MAG: hypothetical protein LBJ41_05130 [Treponema sp.]|nr:hypothetical protein [Treponema sp.]